MEDILASIRRILSDDEAEQTSTSTQPPAETPPMAAPSPHLGVPPPPKPDVLALDARMIVEEPRTLPPPQLNAPAPSPTSAPSGDPPAAPKPALVAPEAAAAAASSVGNLLRTLVAERDQVAVFRGGPTIEDLVREELRPLLKQWLDDQLPLLVERLVRAEIERVVGRAGG
jgi:cell pole-organizing protein PopZ